MANEMNIENVNRVVPKGEPTKYTIKRGETLTLDNVPQNALFMLVYINDGSEGIDIGLENGGRRFVPTFDQKKAENELIVQWSNLGQNAEPEARANNSVIKLRGHVIKDLGTISINGEGFESVEIEMYEYTPEYSTVMSRSRQAINELVEDHYQRTIKHFPNQAAKDPETLKTQILNDLLACYGLTQEDLVDITTEVDEVNVTPTDTNDETVA